MGNNESTQEGYGYQVIEVKANSPVEKAGLEIFLDFIIGLQDDQPSTQQQQFFKLIESKQDKEIQIIVYNLRTKKTRIIKTVPSRSWPDSDSLLGAILRYESYKSYHEKTFRILNVLKNSPASEGGFQQDTDYIIGLIKYRYNDLNQLIDKIHNNEELEFGLYNTETGLVRIGKLKLSNKWGGQGLMGCQLGSGILNQLVFVQESDTITQKENAAPILKETVQNIVQNPKIQEKNYLQNSQFPFDKEDKFVEHYFNGFLRYNNTCEIKENEGSFSVLMENSSIQNSSVNTDSLYEFSKIKKDSINSSSDQFQLNQAIDQEIMGISPIRDEKYIIDPQDLFQMDVQIDKKVVYID